MKILTWNIKGLFRAASAPDPLDALAALPNLPDVLTLQEVTLTHAPTVRERLRDMGYKTLYSGRKGAEHSYGNVIAARTRVRRCGLASFNFPIPQLAVHAIVDTPDGPINVVTVHIPNGENHGWRKIDAFDALKQLVLRLKGQPLILTGDFNEPNWAVQDERIVTYGQVKNRDRWHAVGTWTHKKSGVTDRNKRWDTAVRWFFERRQKSGLRVAFWEIHGRCKMEASYLAGGPQPKC